MCNSQAEGGQRCFGHAAELLKTASAKYQGVIAEAAAVAGAGRPIPAELNVKGMQAKHALDDARARYASTPQGQADLDQRMRDLNIHAMAFSSSGPAERAAVVKRELYHAYAQAISEGKRIRFRATAAHDGVKAGTMTGEQAAQLSKFPTAETLQARAAMGAAVTTPAPAAPTSPATRPSKPARNGYTNLGPRLASTDTFPCALCGYRPVAWIQKFKTPTGQVKYSRTCDDC